MEDSTRFRVQGGELEPEGGGEAESRERRDSELRVGEPQASRASAPSKPFVGNAMLALLESGDVRVARGDETRVITKEHGDVLERFAPEANSGTQLRPVETPRTAARTDSTPAPATTHTSAPPGPRVDVTLWAVLTVGLFAIAAWMMFYAL